MIQRVDLTVGTPVRVRGIVASVTGGAAHSPIVPAATWRDAKFIGWNDTDMRCPNVEYTDGTRETLPDLNRLL